MDAFHVPPGLRDQYIQTIQRRLVEVRKDTLRELLSMVVNQFATALVLGQDCHYFRSDALSTEQLECLVRLLTERV